MHLLSRATEIEARVLSREEEARLAFEGALAGITPRGAVAVCDVGGGSAQVAIGTVEHGPAWLRSVDLGSLRLSARIPHGDPPGRKELAALRSEARAAVSALTPPCPAGPSRSAGRHGRCASWSARRSGRASSTRRSTCCAGRRPPSWPGGTTSISGAPGRCPPAPRSSPSAPVASSAGPARGRLRNGGCARVAIAMPTRRASRTAPRRRVGNCYSAAEAGSSRAGSRRPRPRGSRSSPSCRGRPSRRCSAITSPWVREGGHRSGEVAEQPGTSSLPAPSASSSRRLERKAEPLCRGLERLRRSAAPDWSTSLVAPSCSRAFARRRACLRPFPSSGRERVVADHFRAVARPRVPDEEHAHSAPADRAEDAHVAVVAEPASASVSGTQRASSTSLRRPQRAADRPHQPVADDLRPTRTRRRTTSSPAPRAARSGGRSPPRPRAARTPRRSRPGSVFPFGSVQSSYFGRWTMTTSGLPSPSRTTAPPAARTTPSFTSTLPGRPSSNARQASGSCSPCRLLARALALDQPAGRERADAPPETASSRMRDPRRRMRPGARRSRPGRPSHGEEAGSGLAEHRLGELGGVTRALGLDPHGVELVVGRILGSAFIALRARSKASARDLLQRAGPGPAGACPAAASVSRSGSSAARDIASSSIAARGSRAAARAGCGASGTRARRRARARRLLGSRCSRRTSRSRTGPSSPPSHASSARRARPSRVRRAPRPPAGAPAPDASPPASGGAASGSSPSRTPGSFASIARYWATSSGAETVDRLVVVRRRELGLLVRQARASFGVPSVGRAPALRSVFPIRCERRAVGL